MTQEAKELPVNDFADRLVSRMEEFAAEHRAYLPLMAAPLKFSRDAASKRNLRAQFSKAFRARSQSLTSERSLLIASVVLQIMKGMVMLYAEGAPKDRALINAEFKRVLANYLGDVL